MRVWEFIFTENLQKTNTSTLGGAVLRNKGFVLRRLSNRRGAEKVALIFVGNLCER